MHSTESLPDDWQQALTLAQTEAMHVREGLTAEEFAKLAQVHPNTVGKYARRGIERFQAKFGSGCTFEKVNRPGSSQMQWRLTFVGPLKESPEKPPVPGALRAKEFAERPDVPSLASLYEYHLKGHTWFRQRFPGWDYLEVPFGTECVLRWYVPVESTTNIGDDIPEDDLTAKQFALLKGVHARNLENSCRLHGKPYFEARFPGWSFREVAGKRIFFRQGVERPRFSRASFAEHIGQTVDYVDHKIRNGIFEATFPGWEVRSFLSDRARVQTHMISPILCALPEPVTVDTSNQAAADKNPTAGEDSSAASVDQPGFDVWQLALVQSYCETVYTRTGLGTPDFCELTECSSTIVLGAVNKGVEHFQSRFGAGCSFKKVASNKQPYKYEFTLVGRIYPTALAIPGLRLLAVRDFAYEQEWAETDVWKVMELGHQAVRANFPDWDYLELAHPYKEETVWLFMPILNGLAR